MTWRERIVAARESGGFSLSDVRQANNWNQCAVAEQHAAHPHAIVVFDPTILIPQDADLYGLGDRFGDVVRRGDVEEAEALLDKIEDRVLQLKREATA